MESEEEWQEAMAAHKAKYHPIPAAPLQKWSKNSSSSGCACLDFYYKVMQGTPQKEIEARLDAAWSKDGAVTTLKLIFQLRDIHHGKGTKLEFYHCLSWLYKNHYQTLLKNLKFIPRFGCWKDLLWLIQFIIYDQNPLSAKEREAKEEQLGLKPVSLDEFQKQEDKAQRFEKKLHWMGYETGILNVADWRENSRAQLKQMEMEDQQLVGNKTVTLEGMMKKKVFAKQMETKNQQLDYKTVTLEEVIKKRVDGLISKTTWKAYLAQLPDPEAKKKAKEKFQELAKDIHAQRQKEAKTEHSAKDREASSRISVLMADPNFKEIYTAVVELFANALKSDVNHKDGKVESTALAGKWAPTINGSFDRSTGLGKSIARSLYQQSASGGSAQDNDKEAFSLYQKKYLTPLRKAIDIVEKHMSENKWSEINYERVPSVAMKRYKKSFLEHDKERFSGFLQAVKKREKKIAYRALLPHEIIGVFTKSAESEKELEEVAEFQWKSYITDLKKAGSMGNVLAVCNVSQSTNEDATNAAVALSLLVADLSQSPFNGIICSLSDEPQLHSVNQPNLKEKVDFTRRIQGVKNINMKDVFNVILSKAVAEKLPPSEMVKTVFLFSDVEIDVASEDYDFMQQEFGNSLYTLPDVVFWNLHGGSSSVPLGKGDPEGTMASGFSGQMLRMFLQNKKVDSYFLMLGALDKYYDHLILVD